MASSTIDFRHPQNVAWHGPRRQAQFWVRLGAEEEILCRVSRQVLIDHLGHLDSDRECLHAAREHFREIAQGCGKLIESSRFEDDGSVVLRAEDWPAAPA